MKTQATQIYLPYALHFEVKQIAKERGLSLTSLVNEQMEKLVKARRNGRKKLSDFPNLNIETDENFNSENINTLLYGDS